MLACVRLFRRQSLLTIVAGCLALLGWPAGGTQPASADPFGYPNPGYVADGADHWYCYTSAFDSTNRSRAAASMAYLDDTTDMYDVYAGATCGTSTDVVWIRDDAHADPYGDPVRGANYCVAWTYFSVCDQYWTVINQLQIYFETLTYAPGDVGPNFEVNMVKTIRHELGHSAGLSHSPTAPDAMRSGWVDTNLVWCTYSQHHVGHVDSAY